MQDLRAGQLVSSTRGRDRGRYYLVFGLLGPRVHLVNGENRTPAQPKKKNQSHVRIHDGLSGELAEKFVAGARVDNAEIKRVLAELTGKAGPDPGEGGKDGDGETGRN